MRYEFSAIFNAEKNRDIISFRNFRDEKLLRPFYAFIFDTIDVVIVDFVKNGNGCEIGFATEAECQDAINKINLEEYNPVYLVLKNSDFTKGQGPMAPHKIFKTCQQAVDYIMSQDGIYESRQRYEEYLGVNYQGGLYEHRSFNGYEIKVMNIE